MQLCRRKLAHPTLTRGLLLLLTAGTVGSLGDTDGHFTTAPDGQNGYKVHHTRPALDGMRGRNDPNWGTSSDHNFDADHTLAPTNPRTAWALHHASALGDVDEVMRLLEGCLDSHMRNCNRSFYGVNVDAKEMQLGRTSMHRAAEHDRYDVAVELLKYNASVNVTDKYFWTPLHKTAEKGWLEFSRLLLSHDADVGAVDKYGWTPLHRASDKGNLAVAKLLANNGANLNHGRASLGHFYPDVHAYANQDGTPLHHAARRGHAHVVRWLIESGADIDARDKNGWVPLYYAAESGQLHAVQVLIEKDAQLNVRGVSGGTPLFIATANGHAAVHEALGKAGATYTTPLGEGLRSSLPNQGRDYEFNVHANWVPPNYGGNGIRYVEQGTDTYVMLEQPGLPSINRAGLSPGQTSSINTYFLDESSSLEFRDEQHVAPELWVPGATDENPTAGAQHRYTDARGHTIENAVDIGPHVTHHDGENPGRYGDIHVDENPTHTDPMSPDILHTSSATDFGMVGDTSVHPGAQHIDDGYRSGSYRPGGDALGFTSGGFDAGSRAAQAAAQAGPMPGVEIGPTAEIVQGRRRLGKQEEDGSIHSLDGGEDGEGGAAAESEKGLKEKMRERLRQRIDSVGAADSGSREVGGLQELLHDHLRKHVDSTDSAPAPRQRTGALDALKNKLKSKLATAKN